MPHNFKLNSRYRPKVDRPLLQQLVSDAWTLKRKEYVERSETINLVVSELLQSLYPPEDMSILQRYDAARYIQETSVRIYNKATSRWDSSYLVKLTHPVLTPVSAGQLSALRPDWWDDPLLGVKPESRNQMSSEMWDKIVADHQKSKSLNLPKSTDPFFEQVLSLQEQYYSDIKITEWITVFRKSNGQHPTWSEIIERSSVLSVYVNDMN